MSRLLFAYVVRVSVRVGGSRATLYQALMLLGWVEACLELEKPEVKQAFLADVRMHQMMQGLSPANPYAATLRMLGENASTLPIRRGHVRRHPGGSKLILVRVPSQLLAKIDQHSRLIGATRTALLTHILERGLIRYLQSQVALTKTHNEALKTASAPNSTE